MADVEKKNAITSLTAVCEAIANGQFEVMDDLFEIASDNDRPPDIRVLAETFAGMVMQIEARVSNANQVIAALQETLRQLEAENAELRQRMAKP